jgi:chemotaxis signal transduction protein
VFDVGVGMTKWPARGDEMLARGEKVIDLWSGDIVPPPHMGTHVSSSVIHGMGRPDEAFVMVLDRARVFETDEMPTVHEPDVVADAASA